jgi:mRNA interferase RelE/StbE
VAKYALFVGRSAGKEIEALNEPWFSKVLGKIEDLSAEPRPSGCKKLMNAENLWRIRIGDWRVVYEIDEAKKALEILRVRHRREAYR